MDPLLTHEEHLDKHINQASRSLRLPEVDDDPIDRLISSFVPTAETARHFERLDVLVCGRCRAVFHLVDEFKSHSSICDGSRPQEDEHEEAELVEGLERSGGSIDQALGMTLWCSNVRRRLDQQGVAIADRAVLER